MEQFHFENALNHYQYVMDRQKRAAVEVMPDVPNKKGTCGKNRKCLKYMARPKRFELLTYRFVACCSIQLSYERVTMQFILNT